MIYYFETSAINYVCDMFTPEGAERTKLYQTGKGRSWCVSSAGLWEVLCTKDEDRREEVLIIAQRLFSSTLLPSIEELMITFMGNGCPSVEPAPELKSHSQLSHTWEVITDEVDRSIDFDEAVLQEHFRLIRNTSKDLHRITKNQPLVQSAAGSEVGLEVLLEDALNQLSWVREGEIMDSETRLLYKASLYFILFILCAEAGTDRETMQKFWANVGVYSTIDRFRYLVENYETIVHRGPMAMMGRMVMSQREKRFPRGMFFDAMHAVYLTYSHLYFSEDGHFFTLREKLGHHPDAIKLVKPSECSFYSI